MSRCSEWFLMEWIRRESFRISRDGFEISKRSFEPKVAYLESTEGVRSRECQIFSANENLGLEISRPWGISPVGVDIPFCFYRRVSRNEVAMTITSDALFSVILHAIPSLNHLERTSSFNLSRLVQERHVLQYYLEFMEITYPASFILKELRLLVWALRDEQDILPSPGTWKYLDTPRLPISYHEIRCSYLHCLFCEDEDFSMTRPLVPFRLESSALSHALRARDLEAATILNLDPYPLSSTAAKGDLSLFRRLLEYNAAPNDGPSFPQRPLQTAILYGHVQIAQLLVRNGAVADLGDLTDTVSHAVLRGDLELARAMLNKPRKLVSQDTKRLPQRRIDMLRENFVLEYQIFQEASTASHSSPAFRFLATYFQDRSMWKLGMSTIRRLNKGRTPQDIRQVVSLLVVASSMRKFCKSKTDFGDLDLFLEDLDRWRCLAIRVHEEELFDEVAMDVWGKLRDAENSRMVEDFEQELEKLINLTEELLSDMEESLPPRALGTFDFDGPPSKKTSIRLIAERKPRHEPEDDEVRPSLLFGMKSAETETDRLPLMASIPLGSHGEWTPASKIAVMLMIGAIFMCVTQYTLMSLNVARMTTPSSCPEQQLESVLDILDRVILQPLQSLRPSMVWICRQAENLIKVGTIISLAELRVKFIVQAQAETESNFWDVMSAETIFDSLSRKFLVELAEIGFRDRYDTLRTYLSLECSLYNIYADIFDESLSPENSVTTPENNDPFSTQFSSPPPSTANVVSLADKGVAVLEASSDETRWPAQVSTHGSEIRCIDCSKSFTTNTNLYRHIREQHSGKTPMYRCKKGCGAEFTRNEYRKVHEVERCINRNAI